MTYGKRSYISRQVAYQRNRNVITMSATKASLGPVTNAIFIILVLCLIGLMYLTQVTKTNALGYRLSELNTKQSQLKEEYASLEVESMRLQGLDRVKSSTVAKNMPEVKPSATLTN